MAPDYSETFVRWRFIAGSVGYVDNVVIAKLNLHHSRPHRKYRSSVYLVNR